MLSARTKVLVVDDSPTMRKIIRKLLLDNGVSAVIEAQNGKAAIEILEQTQPDVVLSDYDMTPIDGKELLSYIRGHARLSKLPFVMVTAHMVRFADSGRDGGITHYVAKPFNGKELREKIVAVLSAKQMMVV